MPSLMERAGLLATTLGIRPDVLERDGILGVIRAASAMLGWRPMADMVLSDMLDALAEGRAGRRGVRVRANMWV